MKITQADYYKYRLLEVIPGAMVWLTFLFVIAISIFNPVIAIYFVIAFYLYFVLKVFYMMIFMVLSWTRYRRAIKTDWWEYLQKNHPTWSDYTHLIFLPTAGEPFEVVDTTFEKMARVNYDRKKMIMILAGEERFKDQFEPLAKRISEKYADKFYKIIITLHPDNIPGEIKGKGANIYHAGHEVKKFVDQNSYDYKKLIVSTFDIDTITHPDYFAYLTYKFVTDPNPYRASFQPMAFYHNNVWSSDIITRVVANSTTFWLMTDLARPERLFTFSSHSMSWQALVDIGFWQNNIVTEDSRIFLQCFIHYNGDYRVVPMHIPVSMNTVYTGNFWRSMVNQYKQMRRWAYGVEHFPYMVWMFRRNLKIPFRKKLIYIWNQTEGVYSWATVAPVIFVMGFLPLYIAEKYSIVDVLTQNTPLLLEIIMRSGMIGIVLIAIMSVVILPPLPDEFKQSRVKKYTKYLLMGCQWLLFPVTMILFGSIPSVDAQTRLMLGKYLGFWVTEKRKT